MKEVYIAYFDFLGFKEFILKNDYKTLKIRMEHIFRDIEICLGQGKYQDPINGILLADISRSRLNCLNISDTVIFWTKNCELNSLKELINVAYEFNWRENSYNFPLRGCIMKGKINEVTDKKINPMGGSYSVQCVYGKGIIEANEKANCQNWAGTVVDKTIIEDLRIFGQIEFIKAITLKCNVPYKTNIEKVTENIEEYVFKIRKDYLNKTVLKNVLHSIDVVFSQDNKSVDSESVKQKIENTKKFILDTNKSHKYRKL